METIGYTRITFSWVDRIRILLGKKPEVTIKTSLPTRDLPEDFQMETKVHVEQVFPQRRSRQGFGEVQS